MTLRIVQMVARVARPVGFLTLFVVGSSCRRPPQTAGGPYGDLVAQAVPAVEKAVGLRFKTPPKIEVRTRDQVRAYVLKQITDSANVREIAGQSAAYKLLGMIPDTLDLSKLMTHLLDEQIVGFYDPETKVLYIVKDSPKESAQVIVTHELVHALQDQYVNLDSIQKLTNDNDRQSAAQAVFEGEAVYEQIQAMLGPGNLAVGLPGGWDRVRQTIRDNESAMPVYASAPMVIQETLIFPYLSGAEFVKNFRDRKPGRAPFTDLPASTAQILHPNEFFEKRVAPTAVSFAPIAGVTPTYQNDLGEFETRLFLYEQLNNVDDAARAASGWNGDRYMTFDTPHGPAIAWASVWLTDAQAIDFHTMAQRADSARGSARRGRSVRVSTGVVDGRPVVLLVDTPAGVAAPITIQNIRLTRQH
ncbi:MAG: DUF6782 family putative metallopeptidase [Gemmatimonadaceae bacterium]